MQERPFDCGVLVATASVNERMTNDQRFYHFARFCLARHLNGDWGDLEKEDRELNDEAVVSGERLHSAYIYKPTSEKLWIITEADRSVTTLLFPEDY